MLFSILRDLDWAMQRLETKIIQRQVKEISNQCTELSYTSSFSHCTFKQHVPMPSQELLCDKGCYVARYCPLVLAWAMTVHTCQGFEAGFQKGYLINHIIASLNNLDWRNKMSRHSLCCNKQSKDDCNCNRRYPHPSQYNSFYIGQIGTTCFTRVAYETDRETYVMVLWQDA